MNEPGISTVETELIAAAVDARKKAYAPYSKFPVGVALRTTDGKTVTGVNVENASYGLTMCAERVAVGAAVADGHQTFSHVAIASRGGVSPCGACRQVLAQFGRDIEILLVDTNVDPARPDGSNDSCEPAIRNETLLRRYVLSELLPDAFVFKARP